MALILVFVNQSNLAEVSDYNVKVLVGDGSPRSKVIDAGKVLGHKRSEGYEALVQKWLDSKKE